MNGFTAISELLKLGCQNWFTGLFHRTRSRKGRYNKRAANCCSPSRATGLLFCRPAPPPNMRAREWKLTCNDSRRYMTNSLRERWMRIGSGKSNGGITFLRTLTLVIGLDDQ